MKVSRYDLHSDYLSWCADVGEKLPLDRTALFEHVRKVAGVSEGSWRQMGIQSPVRGFKGIGLADAAVEV